MKLISYENTLGVFILCVCPDGKNVPFNEMNGDVFFSRLNPLIEDEFYRVGSGIGILVKISKEMNKWI
jgi:hypothetical protein